MSQHASPAEGDAPGGISAGLALGTWAGAWVLVNVVGAVIAGATTPAGEDPAIATLVVLQLVGAVIFGAGIVFASSRARARAGRTRLPTFAELRGDYQLRFVPADLAALPLGVATQLLAVPLVYLPLRQLWPDTFNADRLSETAGDLVDRAGSGLTLAALFVAVCLVAPLVEELVYRGLVQGGLTRRLGRIAGWLTAAALFAIVHFRPVEYPGLFVAGLVFGACLAFTGRLAPAILCHLAFNVTGLVLAL